MRFYVALELDFKPYTVDCDMGSELKQACIVVKIGRQRSIYKPSLLPMQAFDDLESILAYISVDIDHTYWRCQR